MRIILLRFAQQPGWTLGALFIDERFECFTVEDEARAIKVPGVTAIPEGIYSVRITYSPKFNRMLPLIENVPGFDGIRIHIGNTAADTDGCIIPGVMAAAGRVLESRAAFDALYAKIQEAQDRHEEISITIFGY